MWPIETDLGPMSSLGVLTAWLNDEEQVTTFNKRQAALGFTDMVSIGPAIMVESWVKNDLTPLEYKAVLLHEEGYIRNMGGPTGTMTLSSDGTVDIYPEVSVVTDLELQADAYALASGANADALVSATYKLLRRQRERVGTDFYKVYKLYRDVYRARFDAIKPYCFTR